MFLRFFNRLLRDGTLDVEFVMNDFEIAAKIAFEILFPNCKAIGCVFHFGQSLFKKFVTFGLKTTYLENVDIQIWFKSIFSLALIPMLNNNFCSKFSKNI